MTKSYCFARCSSDSSNAAPGANNSVPTDVGYFACNETNGGLTSPNFRTSQCTKVILHPNIEQSGPKTAAILLKHDQSAVAASRYAREFMQGQSFVLNSEPFPKGRVEVGAGKCRKTFNNVFSEREFVLVVITVDGTSIKMYKNGVLLGSHPCSVTPQTNSNLLWLGGNCFGGTIKSFALWNRALSAVEVAGLDSSQLTCGNSGIVYKNGS